MNIKNIKNSEIAKSEIEEQVFNFMSDLGILPAHKQLIIDGNLHRYKTLEDKGSEKSGAYCIYPDNLPAGFVQDWRKGIKAEWVFKTDNLKQEQREYFNSPEVRAEAEKLRKQRAKQNELDAIKASENARTLWESLPSADESHPYLQRKKVRNYGLHVNNENSLAVPLKDIKGTVKSLQWITKDGSKWFYHGVPTSGLFWAVALDTFLENNGVILLGEGYATMAKIYELTNLPCVAAMTCGNLHKVAEALKKTFKAKIIIMADDDAKTKENPGLTHAKKTCEILNLQGFFSPPFKNAGDGTDWDDFAIKYGDDLTAKILKDKISWLCLSESEKKEFENRKNISALISNLNPAIQVTPLELIGQMFPRKFVSAIVAPSGTGKTMFVQRFVSDLSIGGIIFDGFAEDETPRKSLIFAGEAGFELLIRRATATKWGINPQNVQIVDQYKFESNNVPVSIDSDEGWKNIKRIVDMCKPDIIFFDTFSSFHDKDENKATDMKPLIKKLADLARDYNLALVLVHHSRKRTAKERSLTLNQDDVIGSSVFNRLIGLIIGIEPMNEQKEDEIKEDGKNLLVRTLKTWFSYFTPFSYKISESSDGKTTILETDLAPQVPGSSKNFVWNYLQKTFPPGKWFSWRDIDLNEIESNVSERNAKAIIANFVKNKKIKKRGTTKNAEYCLYGFYDKQN